MQLNSSDDMFNFTSSWITQVNEGRRVLTPEKEEKEATVKESTARGDLLQTINDLVPEAVQTQADFFDRKVFNPIYNDGNLHPAISNYIRNKAVSAEEAQKIIDSVADRLINFNPEAKRKSGDGKITLGEFIFSNVNFGQRDARKALFEESQERAQVESTDSEQARQIATAEESAPQVEKPKYKSLTQRKVLSEEAIGPARQKVLSIARVLKSPIDANVSKNVTVTPLAAEIKKAVGKQLDIDFKKEMGGLKDGQLRKYLLKNKAAILENMTTTWLMTAMPNAVQKQVNGVWTSDWKGKKVDREKTSTNNAGRTSGAEMVRRLPKAATRLSDAEFLSNFFTEDGKLIRGRKESLSKAMAEETGFEIIREALNDPNSEIAQAFLAAQERAGAKDLANIGVKFDVMAERGNVKFSVALGKTLQNIGKGIRSEFDMQLPKNRDKGINKVLKIHNFEPVFKLDTIEDIKAWGKATEESLLPIMPKWYWFTESNGVYKESANSAFRRSARMVGDRSLDGEFIKEINRLRALPESSFGKIDGINEKMTGTYKTKIGETEEQFIKNYENGNIAAFNEYNTKMHKAFWTGINKTVREGDFNPDAVRAISHYLTLVSNDTSHVHKMGAEFVGYTTNAQGKTSSNGRFKRYEMEHAMPATNAYLYLMDAVLNGYDFDAAYNAVMSNYKLIALDAADDLKLKAAGLSNGMPEGWSVLENGWHERYSSAGVDLSTIIMNNGQTLAEIAGVNKFGEPMSQNGIEFNKKVDQQALADTKEAMEPSVRFSRATPRAVFMVGGPGAGKTNVGKGLKLGRRGFKVINQDLALEPMKIEAGLPANEQQYTREQRSTRAKLGAAARKAAEAKMAKYMGFGESMVVDGTGASYNATMKKINALRDAGYEVSIVFANTSKEEAIARNKARAERALPDMIVKRTWDAVQESAKLYKQEFGNKFYEVNTNELKLGQSLPTEFLNKLYEDLDVSGIRYSNALSKKFNQIVERRTGVDAVKNFSRIQAQMRGRNKGRFKFFIAPGADDFRGLVHYAFAGKGKQGEADMAWFEEKLMTPYFKGVSAIDAMRQQIKRDFRVVTKQFKQEYKMLKKKIGGGMFTYDHALRVYMWDRQGLEVEGLSKRDKKLLLDAIAKNPELVSLADALLVVSRRDEWPDPAAHWEAGSVLSDLNGMTEKIGRKKFLQEFIENAEVIFSEENLNKIEAIYGRRHREALEDSLYAMKNGTNRPTGSNRQVNAWLNWINGSTGAIMFFNRRSALLQMLSFTNFINWSDNNMVKAAGAFANQKQYWSDWAMIFNSDKLKERRGGLKQDVSESEIAAVAKGSKNSPQAILSYLLKIGFTPTQIADSMAIATGGAMFYRNRVNTYLKQGMDQKAAEEQAFLDFSMKSDEAQQSSDPALVSQQQRSVLGRLVLAFANTPMQYTRLMKKAGQDLINGRGRPIENISKIAYYGVIQNFIFSALQSALFAMAFDDDDDEELSEAEVERKAAKEEQKTVRVVNSMLDTILRGSGVYGAVASTMKNAIMEYYKQEEKGFMGDHTYTLLAAAGISPPIQSKFRKIYSAIQTSRFEKDNVEARGWALTADGRLNLGPNWSIFGNVLSGITNVPLDRVVDELKSVSEALDERNQAWQRIALALGWKTWDVGVRNEEADLIKTEAKEARKQEGIRKAKETRRINTEAKKKKEAEEAQDAFEAWEKEFVKKQRKNQEN
jgi:predicted kinase